MQLNARQFFISIFLDSLFLFPVIFNAGVFAQQSNLSKAVNYLSGFIASDYFRELKKSNNDLALVDTIYL
ncbi:MAG TPA: hypothetical protein ENI61_04830, partial [Ignavibacteria bacterium]|nr:hypothetical protein [Ignavibacteria bacterium]